MSGNGARIQRCLFGCREITRLQVKHISPIKSWHCLQRYSEQKTPDSDVVQKYSVNSGSSMCTNHIHLTFRLSFSNKAANFTSLHMVGNSLNTANTKVIQLQILIQLSKAICSAVAQPLLEILVYLLCCSLHATARVKKVYGGSDTGGF